MDEFVKPKHIVINPMPYLKEILGNGIIKDLQEDEEICPVCHGTGLELVDNEYGLKGDTEYHNGKMWPYKHQSIVSCRNCYGGVVKKCKYCGKLLNRHTYECNCEESHKARAQADKLKRDKEEQERFNKAQIIEPDSPIVQQFGMLYSECYGYNEGYFADWEEFFDYWDSNYVDNDKRPQYVWSTTSTQIGFDADSMIEEACQDLHEEAEDQINLSDRKELQNLLDKWASKQTGTTTYYVDYKYAIRIPWEEYDKEER